MSCGPCNCDDCKVDRLEEDFVPPIRLTWRDAEPANEVQAKAWVEIASNLFHECKINAINLPAMIYMVVGRIPGLRTENYDSVSLQVERFIRESPSFELRQGKNGGVFRKTLNFPVTSGTLPAPIPHVVAVTVNNHTCSACGNNKCSKDEKSCWKCGASIT